MFDFGKDLKKLFALAREGDDLGWLELIGLPLLESEARQQSVNAGRVSCRRPAQTALRAAAVWREHARRTGRATSIAKALLMAADAGREAEGPETAAEAMLDAALTTLLDYDLRGGPDRLARAATFLQAARAGQSAQVQARVMGAHARLSARRSEAGEGDKAKSMQDAAALLDAALHGFERVAGVTAEAAEVRLDRAALTLEAGVRARDARLLDQAGRDLRLLVEGASPDYQPLTRARALTLCAAGLNQLAELAGDETARGQAQQMFDAAADTFTQDHSPLDWIAIQLAMAAEGRPPTRERLMQAEVLAGGEGLILGALAREARTSAEVAAAEADGDLTGLGAIDARLRRRLAGDTASAAPLDWAADQMGLARTGLARARLMGAAPEPLVRLALVEAIMVARDEGGSALAERAEVLSRSMALGR